MYRVEKLNIRDINQSTEKLNQLADEGYHILPGAIFEDNSRVVVIMKHDGTIPEKEEKQEPKKKAPRKRKAKNSTDISMDDVDESWEEVTVT